MSGDDTWVIAVGFDLDAKGLTKALSERSESTIEVELLRPRAHWKKVAKAFAKTERPHVRRLVLRALAFDPSAAVGRAMLSPKAGDALWAALPNLEELELVGHAWATTLAHPALRELRMMGIGLTGSFSKKPADCPKLERLTWAFTGDEFGVAPSVSHFKALWKAEGLSALRHLDFGGADLDGDLLSGSSFMKSALLGQLESLVLPEVSIDTLPKKLPKLDHVKRVGLANGSLPDTRVETVTVAPMPVALMRSGDDLSAFLINDERLGGLLAALEAQPTITGLALTSHDISAEAGRLGEALAAHRELRSLALDRPHIYGLKAEGLAALAKRLGAHPGLKKLDLRGNRLTGAAAPLVAWLSSLPALESLDLDQIEPGEGELETIVAGLGECASLRELTIGGNAKGDAARPLGALASPSLERLAVWGLKAVSPEVASELVGGLADRLPKLRSLRLGGYFDAASAGAVTEALRGAPLASFGIGLKNGLEGLAGIGAALPSLTRLELESMGSDALDVANAERLARVIAGAGSLAHLTLADWKLDETSVGLVFDALATHDTLRSVSGIRSKDADLERIVRQVADSQVRVWADLPYDLSEALVRANLVEDLRVESRKLEKWTAKLPLAECTSITTLRLVGGMLEPATLEALAKVSAEHDTLRTVTLKGGLETEPLLDFVDALEGASLERVTFDVWAPAAVVAAVAERTDRWSGPTLVL